MSNYDLLVDGSDGRLALSAAGRSFLDEPLGETVRTIDVSQGLSKVLEGVADLGPTTRSNLLPEWKGFLRSETNVRADSAAKASLWARLRNLNDRGLIDRVGNSYAISAVGLEYLHSLDSGSDSPDDEKEIRRLLRDQSQRIREQIMDLLADMDPYEFEQFIARLFQEMGYEDTEVTSQSNDKGVDVVANIQVGITQVREVIQVKRMRSNIGRPVLDQLRGVLHRWAAVRGTIVSLGDFSKGAREAALEVGAAPITLINGEKLIDLLIDNGIGVRKKEIETLELDESAFSGEPEED